MTLVKNILFLNRNRKEHMDEGEVVQKLKWNLKIVPASVCTGKTGPGQYVVSQWGGSASPRSPEVESKLSLRQSVKYKKKDRKKDRKEETRWPDRFFWTLGVTIWPASHLLGTTDQGNKYNHRCATVHKSQTSLRVIGAKHFLHVDRHKGATGPDCTAAVIEAEPPVAGEPHEPHEPHQPVHSLYRVYSVKAAKPFGSF